MTDIIVTPLATTPQKGTLRFGTFRTPCALGHGGLTDAKQEGDGKTPIGRFALRRLWLRTDRLSAPVTCLPTYQIRQKSGWCDDINAALYNRPITRPDRHTHERLWRHDRLYDVIVELGYNDNPPVKPLGSAIFLHLEKNNYHPTLGCIAISRAAMLHILPKLDVDSHLEVKPNPA